MDSVRVLMDDGLCLNAACPDRLVVSGAPCCFTPPPSAQTLVVVLLLVAAIIARLLRAAVLVG